MAESLHRLQEHLQTDEFQALYAKYEAQSSESGRSISQSDIEALLRELGTAFETDLSPVLSALQATSRLSTVTQAELTSALQTWLEGELSPGLSMQDLTFDPRQVPVEAKSQLLSDSTLARADSQDVTPSSKTKQALEYLSSHKPTLRTEYESKGAVGAAEELFNRVGLHWDASTYSAFDSLWMSASTIQRPGSPAPIDTFEEVFVPTLSQFLVGRPLDVTQQLIVKLQGTIKEVEAIEASLRISGQDASDTRQLLKSLRGQLEQLQLSAKKKKSDRPFALRCEKALHEIYYFYAKQSKMVGKTPSFDQILHSTTTLNLGKFLKFLRDFQVLEAIKPKHRKVIDRETATRTFKKSATLQKEMDEIQFKTALDLLSLAFYDGVYDEVNKTNVARLGLPEKREMLYRLLELDAEERWMKKMKGFGVPFSSYADSKLPVPEPVRAYRYRPTNRQSLQQWKPQSKATSHQPSQRESKPQSSPQSPPRLRPAKKPPLAPKARSISNSQDFFLTQPLEAINPSQLAEVDSDFDLKDLILEGSSDEDETLARQYPMKTAPVAVSQAEAKGKRGGKEEEPAARALKVTKTQLERGRKVQERLQASAAKFQAS